MSDTDDTDVLVLIPPNLFLVQSSDTEDSNDLEAKNSKSSVVSELVEHVFSLESRIEKIETEKKCNTPSPKKSLNSLHHFNQTIPRTKYTVSPKSSSEFTSKFNQSASVPSSPTRKKTLRRTNHIRFDAMLRKDNANSAFSSNSCKKHDCSTFSDFNYPKNTSPSKGLLHAGDSCFKNNACSTTKSLSQCFESEHFSKTNNAITFLNSSSTPLRFTLDSKRISDISISEMDDTLQNFGVSTVLNSQADAKSTENLDSRDYTRTGTSNIKPKYTNGYKCNTEQMYQTDKGKKNSSEYSVALDSSFTFSDTEKYLIGDYKPWMSSNQTDEKCSNINKNKVLENHENTNDPNNCNGKMNFLKYNGNNNEPGEPKAANTPMKSYTLNKKITDLNSDYSLSTHQSCPNIIKFHHDTDMHDDVARTSEFSKSFSQNRNINGQSKNDVQDDLYQKPQRLLTLSDFWDTNSIKSQEETIRIKLEEERFRREHCEKLIQDLQKALLEQQEKVAVAIRVDNEKNTVISQFQGAWNKLKQRLHEIETDYENLKRLLQNISDKHKLEILDYQEQLKKLKDESSKAIDLATGYKEKSDILAKEKLDIIKNHDIELENYKSMVNQAESRLKDIEDTSQRIVEKNHLLEDSLKSAQQELHKERLKGGEIRSEMGVIHKALDSCEAELTILRQEKENLQLKVKEELNRNSLLKDENISLVQALEEANKREKQAKCESQALLEQQEKIKSELRDVYQKQVDEVVRTKLKEFQAQLDTAEANFQIELECKQRRVAECCARRIKSASDKHRIEVNILEEKHKEEKRLFEIRLAQAIQKSKQLEVQLNSQQENRNQLVEQLYSMMQRQWQQALQIISGGNREKTSPFQRTDVEKLFQHPSSSNFKGIGNYPETMYSEPVKLQSHKNSIAQGYTNNEFQNESIFTSVTHEDPMTSRNDSSIEMKKYIKMILDTQKLNAKTKLFSTQNSSSPSQNDTCKKTKSGETSCEESSVWPAVSERSLQDTEYMELQKCTTKSSQKQKPPWK